MDLVFTQRNDLFDYEWDNEKKNWVRPGIDGTLLRKLSDRSNISGILRIAYFLFLLAIGPAAALFTYRFDPLLAIPFLYVYYFFYGFWVAIAHELQHKTVFAKSLDWFSEILFFFVQTILWNSPRYARISHRLHHRYTMVRGIDPETRWPEVITSKWLKKYLMGFILRILVIGAVFNLLKDVWTQVSRAAGVKDRMMRDRCSAKDMVIIRIESVGILFVHILIAFTAIYFGVWQLLLFATIAWQIGMAIENLWHQTEHIGRLYNVNDQRLCTRSVRVGPFIKMIFWGLDDHVEHHLFPIVPSRNLPKLHKELTAYVPEQKNIIACWKEMFAITREKDRNPASEFVPIT
jgi:fatty acid desaturase